MIVKLVKRQLRRPTKKSRVRRSHYARVLFCGLKNRIFSLFFFFFFFFPTAAVALVFDSLNTRIPELRGIGPVNYWFFFFFLGDFEWCRMGGLTQQNMRENCAFSCVNDEKLLSFLYLAGPPVQSAAAGPTGGRRRDLFSHDTLHYSNGFVRMLLVSSASKSCASRQIRVATACNACQPRGPDYYFFFSKKIVRTCVPR